MDEDAKDFLSIRIITRVVQPDSWLKINFIVNEKILIFSFSPFLSSDFSRYTKIVVNVLNFVYAANGYPVQPSLKPFFSNL